MRTLLLLLLILPATITLAQDPNEPRTLFGSGSEHDNGGWGAPSVALTEVMGKPSLLTGIKGGWLVDHRFTLGIAGYGLVTDVPNKGYDAYLVEQGETVRHTSQLRMGYGGLLLEPVIGYRSPVHVTLPVLIGAGGCAYQTFTPWQPGADTTHRVDWFDRGQAFFVLEPGVEVELSLVRIVRLAVGASYRFTSDIDLPATPKDALRGFSGAVTLKVGRF
ncbi:MAG: hypothetical protein KDB93_08885 [Flavobacteriales bacterium]|nr:hypothetical protein [Flavobacteriales bacterium]